MIKKVFLTFVIISSLTSFAQRGQKIGYVDMEYILENIPEYAQAQIQLDQKVNKWKGTLDQLKSEIETMRADLSNEKALLTEDLISEREEDIYLKEVDLKNLESAYFSSKGSLFKFRKQLVKPIQDKVYNAAQQLGKSRGYDIIFDKSSDVIMIYTNKKADISELVLKSIKRTEKTETAKEKRAERNKKTPTKELSEEAQKKVDERDAKRQETLDKSAKLKTDKLKKREEQKAEIERKRLERQKKREEVRNKLKENKKNSEDEKKENN
ncbi:MAG: OmpH family outer membrane protein [Flavobacteriaceae bacterium]|nr:OmpH family outer membrane protein [Flavobacteriaceae bacterium]